MNVIGLDIGHSAVKVAALGPDRKPVRFLFPSAACPAFAISDDAERARSMLETVLVGDRRFFFGDTARTQGGRSVATGLSESWIETPEHAALLLGAWRKLKLSGVSQANTMLMLGLPTHLYSRQREVLKETVSQNLEVAEVKVLPQAMGPYQAMMLSGSGAPLHGRDMANESWGVVEVGHFTTDFTLVAKGRWVEKASGACSGARVAAEHLVRLLADDDLSVDLPEAEEALITGVVRNFGERLDVSFARDRAVEIVVAEIIDTAHRLLDPFVRKLDGVILAGGGAPLVYGALKAKWPHTVVSDDPRFAVAEGMRRYGVALSAVRELVYQP